MGRPGACQVGLCVTGAVVTALCIGQSFGITSSLSLGVSIDVHNAHWMYCQVTRQTTIWGYNNGKIPCVSIAHSDGHGAILLGKCDMVCTVILVWQPAYRWISRCYCISHSVCWGLALQALFQRYSVFLWRLSRTEAHSLLVGISVCV